MLFSVGISRRSGKIIVKTSGNLLSGCLEYFNASIPCTASLIGSRPWLLYLISEELSYAVIFSSCGSLGILHTLAKDWFVGGDPVSNAMNVLCRVNLVARQ